MGTDSKSYLGRLNISLDLTLRNPERLNQNSLNDSESYMGSLNMSLDLTLSKINCRRSSIVEKSLPICPHVKKFGTFQQFL